MCVNFYFFRSFDKQGKGNLCFTDVACGLAAMDPGTPHGGTAGEIRTIYIGRYYNKSGNGVLSYKEFR